MFISSILVPSWLTSIITFPGVIMCEITRRFFYDIVEIPVYGICYFQFGNPAGYIVHGEVKGIKNSFLVTIGSLIANSFLCMILTLPTMFSIFFLEESSPAPVFIILAWIGFSIGIHAFPSNKSVDNFVDELKFNRQKRVPYFIALPFVLIIKLFNNLNIVWFNLFYAASLSSILPLLLNKFY